MRLHQRPDQAFTFDDLLRLAHLDLKTLDRVAAELVASGLARDTRSADGRTLQYAARSVDDRRDVDALAQLYHQRPVTLVRLVYEQPSTPLRSFADAFRVRRDKDNE